MYDYKRREKNKLISNETHRALPCTCSQKFPPFSFVFSLPSNKFYHATWPLLPSSSISLSLLIVVIFLWKIWPKALPHYVLIFMCRHREMYYYFVHLRSSCYIMPLFLLLISPSALTLSDLYFRNTSLGQKQYSNTSPHRFVVVGFLVPLPQFIFVFYNTSPAH